MKFSVVISTYNGEKYIKEQLESIYNQTVEPYEVIIKDDCSSDNTINIIKKFIEERNPNNWHLYKNKKNLGWMLNFKEAIALCKGNYCILSDQDDIWVYDKIESIKNVLKNNSHIDLLISSYDKISNGKIIETKINDNRLVKIELNKKNIDNHYPGCTYAFKLTLYTNNLKYWNDNLPHDAQLAMFAKMKGTMYWYRKILIHYRIHDNNATKPVFSLQQKKQQNNREILFANLYLKLASESKKEYKILKKYKKYTELRQRLLNEKKLKYYMMLFFYINYYFIFKGYIEDFILCFTLKEGEKTWMDYILKLKKKI